MYSEIKIGIDMGGTFTDFVIVQNGAVEIRKVPSTPDNPSRAILTGLRDLIQSRETLTIIHGSTVATNTLLERKGARVGLLSTKGFEDVLFIKRQTRNALYNLTGEANDDLISISDSFGVSERILATGIVDKPIDSEEIKKIGAQLLSRNIEVVAVCFINSYRNALHEKCVAEELRKAGLTLSVSSELLPEYREYERTATTVVNAYVMPVLKGYLTDLESNLPDARLKIMQSNEGFISALTAGREPVKTILSGPAGGVVSAFNLGTLLQNTKLITLDMGGTSTDVSLIDHRIQRTTDTTIGGFPIKLPMIDIHSVGAGGGSIAHLDQGGALRVGPESAGAHPGPACYGRALFPTVTDANLVLGRLDPDYFLGGDMQLAPDKSFQALEMLSKHLHKSVTETASGIIEVANSNMERAIRVISVERGFDPREFSLLSFGGAGGMHCTELAEILNIPRVIIPKNAGVFSALGMLLADSVNDYSQSIMKLSDEISGDDFEEAFQPFITRGFQELMREGFAPDQIEVYRFVDLRYSGQSYEITVPYSPNYINAFRARHKTLYAYVHPDRPVEIVTLRVKCVGHPAKVDIPQYASKEHEAVVAPAKNQNVVYRGKEYPSAVYHRMDLQPGNAVKGSALIIDFETTVFIPPGSSGTIDKYLNIIITRQ